MMTTDPVVQSRTKQEPILPTFPLRMANRLWMNASRTGDGQRS
ncbi:MAG: hypothetical protein OXF06_12080 [Bacteroidetes bacterium]|nr:hypothetical protein [Bacteroidota bacterium]